MQSYLQQCCLVVIHGKWSINYIIAVLSCGISVVRHAVCVFIFIFNLFFQKCCGNKSCLPYHSLSLKLLWNVTLTFKTWILRLLGSYEWRKSWISNDFWFWAGWRDSLSSKWVGLLTPTLNFLSNPYSIKIT